MYASRVLWPGRRYRDISSNPAVAIRRYPIGEAGYPSGNPAAFWH